MVNDDFLEVEFNVFYFFVYIGFFEVWGIFILGCIFIDMWMIFINLLGNVLVEFSI